MGGVNVEGYFQDARLEAPVADRAAIERHYLEPLRQAARAADDQGTEAQLGHRRRRQEQLVPERAGPRAARRRRADEG